jgi:hypothetical protein
MERDWFLERLQLISHDILTVGEREEKEKRRWTNLGPLGQNPPSQNERDAASHLEGILVQGIQVSIKCFQHYFLLCIVQSRSTVGINSLCLLSFPPNLHQPDGCHKDL